MELLAPLGQVRARRMFGGHGLYVDDLFIALIAFDRLYLKADDQTRSRFEAQGCQAFAYPKGDGETVVMSYWTAPEDAMDSPGAMVPWGRLAVEAALRARQAKDTPVRKRTARKAPAKRPAAAPAPSAAARPTGAARPKR